MPLNFPQMHPESLPGAVRQALPESVLFLDPGLARQGAQGFLRPEDLPFDPREARALLADTLRFGETVANPRDIKAQALMEQAAALSDESGRAIQAEVESRLLSGCAAQGAKQSDPMLAARKQSQMFLLLAWSLEERLVEMRGIDAGLRKSWTRLGESVSHAEEPLDDESDREALSLGRELSGMGLPEPDLEALPWRKLLECFAVLAPAQVLCCADPDIAASLADSGADEAPLTVMPGAEKVYRSQAWRLMGLAALPVERPWLAALVTVAVIAPVALVAPGAPGDGKE